MPVFDLTFREVVVYQLRVKADSKEKALEWGDSTGWGRLDASNGDSNEGSVRVDPVDDPAPNDTDIDDVID
jgi:hypothetical protein